MSKGPTHHFELATARSGTAMFDTCAVVAISGCAFALIVSPLLIFLTSELDQVLQRGFTESRIENRIFWPAVTAICVILAVQHFSRLRTLTLPPNIICLIAYLAVAGASISWAFHPELSFTRFVQQVMVITSIVLPVILAARTTDMVRALFLCFAFASILSVFFVFGRRVTISNNEHFGYAGYFADKNSLGQMAALAFLLAI